MKRAVLELVSTRPVWSVTPDATRAIARAFGDGWDVVSVATPTSSDGDGSGGNAETVGAARDAQVYMGWGIPREVVRAGAGTLEWLHTAAAGVGGSLSKDLMSSGVTLTNSRGVHAEPIADWTLAAIGLCARGFHAAIAAQARGSWAKDAFTDGSVPIRELTDLRVGLIGLGGVGQAIARRCVAVGMTVRAVRRRPALSRPMGVQWVGGSTDVLTLAKQSDVLVIVAPETSATKRMVGAAVLDALPDGAYVINVARGGLLDESALQERLNSGKLGGSVLDVFESEPLPPGHPFWNHHRLIVTPHVSAVSCKFWERQTALIVENIERYLAGRELMNVVDLESGY